MVPAAKLPVSEHTRMPWRIHAMANDFRVEDVWALPTVGGPDDFPRLVALMESFDPAQASPVVAALFALRWRLGDLLGLDRGETGLGTRVPSLRDRLPADLASVDAGAVPEDSPFRPVYLTDREAALEIANETMHGVLHLGWVPDGDGGYRGQMAVLVKPNGLFGRAYMAAIAPFRYALVYPLMLRTIGRLWRTTADARSNVTTADARSNVTTADARSNVTAVRQVTVPDDVRDLSTLPRIDYADAFLVDTSAHPEWTAERWAKAVLEEAPASTRAQLLSGWLALGLKAAESGPSILDWAVRSSTPNTLLLGRDSRIGMPAELLFTLRPEGLLFGTFVQHRTPATRAVWAAVLRTHVRTVLELLERAASADATESAGAG
jgi:Protein of unknown function (DUF2867)